jgi:hypothetical protein
MKQDLKPRFSLRTFFATLLRPLFMSESPTDVLELFISVEGRTDVTPWQTLLMYTCLSLQCRLKRVVYCDNNKQHEFLPLHSHHWNSSGSAVATVIIEHIPKQDPCNNSSSKLILIHTSASKSRSPSASETAAQDVVYTSSQGSPSPQYLADSYAPLTELRLLYFPLACPSAAQISILLSVVNRQAPNYHLYENRCYWLLSCTVWETLKKVFPDCIEIHSIPTDQRSHYCGFAIQKADSVEAVCEMEENRQWLWTQVSQSDN